MFQGILTLASQHTPDVTDCLGHRQVFRLNTLCSAVLCSCHVSRAGQVWSEKGPVVADAGEGWVGPKVGCCKRGCLRVMSRLSQRGHC